MNPEDYPAVVAKYQQLLADAQLQLIAAEIRAERAEASLAELTAQ